MDPENEECKEGLTRTIEKVNTVRCFSALQWISACVCVCVLTWHCPQVLHVMWGGGGGEVLLGGVAACH